MTKSIVIHHPRYDAIRGLYVVPIFIDGEQRGQGEGITQEEAKKNAYNLLDTLCRRE